MCVYIILRVDSINYAFRSLGSVTLRLEYVKLSLSYH